MVPGGRVIGLDISGTFGGGMRGALVDVAGSLIARKVAVTPRISQEDLIGNLVTMASRLADQAQRESAPASAVGIAVPGLINEASGVVLRSPNLPLQEVPLGQILQDRLKIPVFLTKDASAGAIAEYALGAGRPVADMMLVLIGNGVGSAVVSDGRVLRGVHGTAGEIGHIVIDPAGIVCGCGGRGCVETFASVTSIARRYTMAAKEAILAEEVVAKAEAGNPAAVRVWSDALGALATVIATAVAVIDCELVVLSGTMKLSAEALRPLEALLAKRINLVQLPRVEVGVLGETAGVLGAAAIAFERAGLGDAAQEWRRSGQLPGGHSISRLA
jgi:glucokinase